LIQSRGAVTVETAIVMSALLTFMLGAIQFGVVGFLQLTVDAGSFLNAHQTVIGTIDPDPKDATHKVFPQIQVADIANPVVSPAPSPNVYVDYGYNDPNPTVQSASASDRHGGASMLQPYLLQATITKTPFTAFGRPLTVASTATEAQWFETGPHWDISNQQYGGNCTASNYCADPYVDGTNTPPYYISSGYILHCQADQINWTVCPNSTNDFLALGLGSNLDVFNWSNPQPGISGPANSYAAGGATGTFQTMACHQRYFAQLAQFFQSNQWLYKLEQDYTVGSPPNAKNIPAQNVGVQNFKNWNAYPTGSSPGGKAKQAIQTIYSWDVEHGSNPPSNFAFGLNPLTPTVGC